jgi:hypothetical protein
VRRACIVGACRGHRSGKKERCIEVAERHLAGAAEEVQRRGHRDFGLHHAADHERQTGLLGDGGDALRLGDARLHELEVDHAGGALLDDAAGVRGGAHALVGAHRDGHGSGKLGEAGEIVGGQRLFEEQRDDVGALQLVQHLARAGYATALVAIEADARPGGGQAEQREDALDIGGDAITADLHLDVGKTVAAKALPERGQRAALEDRQRDIGDPGGQCGATEQRV